MDRKGKRRKNKGETSKNTIKDDNKKETVKDKEGVNNKFKTGEVKRGGSTREESPGLSGKSSENRKSHSKESLKEPQTSLEEEETYKRQIISNWERYEESQTENEAEEKKGMDINLLLQSSGGSFFRFRDEQEWAEIQETKPQNSEFLSLNSEDLAKAISCIPLPSRLMISEEIFPQKLINKFNKSAKENMQRYKGGNQHVKNKIDGAEVESSSSTDRLQKTLLSLLNDNTEDSDNKTDLIEVENSKNISQDHCDSEPVDCLQSNLPKTVDHLQTNLTKTEEINLKKIPPPNIFYETSPSGIKCSAASGDLDNDEENELNYLLSLNVPVKPQVKCLDKVQLEKTVKENKVAEENVTLFPESKTAASLEDWLDEMLDDET